MIVEQKKGGITSIDSEDSSAPVTSPDTMEDKKYLAPAASKDERSLEVEGKTPMSAVEDLSVGPWNSIRTYTRPLDELLSNQNLLLRAARLTKSELTALDAPGEIARQTLARSPYRSALKRKNIDSDMFLDLFLKKHLAIRTAIKQVALKDQSTRRRQIGEIVDAQNSKFFQGLAEHCENPDELSPLDQQLTASVMSPASTGLIFQSLHVLAFAHFEHFFASLTGAVLDQRDELLGELNETFTWSQIRDPALLQSTKKQLINKTTGNLLRQSMKHWINWYSNKNKMRISDQIRNECEALYDLRNWFAHELSVKTMYGQFANYQLIERVSDHLATLAVFMTASAIDSSRVEGGGELFYAYLTGREVQMIDQSRLNIAEQMCSLALGQLTPPSTIEQHRVNSWIVTKRKSGLNAIVNQVENWDVDQLDPVFALAKLVLLEKKGDARAEALRLIHQGLLHQEDWDSWPLFDELRNEGDERLWL